MFRGIFVPSHKNFKFVGVGENPVNKDCCVILCNCEVKCDIGMEDSGI